MITDKKCPFCNKNISHWPNCSSSTCSDYGNVSYSVFGRGKGAIKQFFHESCFEKYVKKVKNDE